MTDYDKFVELQVAVEEWEAIVTSLEHNVSMAGAMYGAKAEGNLDRAKWELNNAQLELNAARRRRDR